MTKTNKLSYHGHKIKAGRHHLGLYIDDKDLLDYLEEAFVHYAPSNKNWRERNDCRLVASELQRTIEESGHFILLDTSLGYLIPGDVLLANSFFVRHDGDQITWFVDPPGSGVYFETSHQLIFIFSMQQYRGQISKLLADQKNRMIKRPESYSKRSPT